MHDVDFPAADTRSSSASRFFQPARADRKIFVHVRKVGGRRGRDDQQYDDRQFVVETEPDVRPGIGACPEGLQHATAMPVIDDEDGDQGGLACSQPPAKP